MMTDHKTILRDFVRAFKKWLSAHHTPQEIQDLHFDDTSYPDWKSIENYFSGLLAAQQINQLDDEDLANLLYLIAGHWDVGRMIAWLSAAPELSNIGHLSIDDFLILARAVSKLHGAEYNDAKSQFASSFKKQDKLTPETEDTLLELYFCSDEYTKRLSLLSLAKLGYPDIRELLKQSWEMVDEEYHKIGCLQAIDEYIKDPVLLNEYLALTATETGDELQKYVAYLKNR
ncbi:hypothetical protein [Mucilaginibacter sp. SG564]|uniref:hypothetical protein n=1 Tax=Mucilaginibacter sp. SG564 TaxID=2587022 RepID=UPI001552B4A6|nr:hypothetical protein [Mucilaginibacter sp. SG564]NOW94772.1 hypothetical protein [Mucilaginibacter sp. SG564]